MSFDWSAFEAGLPSILASASGLAAGKVIWEAQSAPRPALPYLSLWRMSGTRLSPQPEVLPSTNPTGAAGNPLAVPPTIGTELLVEYRSTEEFTLRVQAYTYGVLGSASAGNLLETVRANLDLSSRRASLLLLGLVLVEADPVRHLPSFVETRLEGRASLDILCRLTQSVSETETIIESVGVTPAYNGVTGEAFIAP